MSKIELYLGDCLKVMDKLMEQGVKVDAVITDPPYGMDYCSNRRREKYGKIKNDDDLYWISDFFNKTFLLLKENTPLYVFCSWHKVDIYKKAIEKNFKIKNILVWVKNNHGSGDLNGSYAPRYEFIIYATKGRFIFNKRDEDVLFFDKTQNKFHPTEKPTELIEFLVEKASNKNNYVLDPFMGSGTTGVACKKLNRNFIGIELDDKYFEIAKNRIEQAGNLLFKEAENGK